MNVDENQGIAAQLKIQSIPTVYGFVDGKPIDAFQGAQPESQIEKMIEKLIEATPGNEIPKLLEEADSFFKDKKFDEALIIYENLISYLVNLINFGFAPLLILLKIDPSLGTLEIQPQILPLIIKTLLSPNFIFGKNF